MFCRWCANGGNLYCCSYCSNTFCYNCIKRNFDPLVRKKIERDEKWKCFVCNPADLYSARAVCWALLEHVQTVTRILQSDRKMSPKEIAAKMELDESQCCPNKNKRKRTDSVSDDEDEDETYSVPKRKRRKLANAKRNKRRVIKMEIMEATPEMQSAEQANRTLASRDRDESNSAPVNSDGQRHSEQSTNSTTEEFPVTVRQTRRRLRSDASNRNADAPSTRLSINDDEIPAPLLQCDQSMIEGAESLSFGDIRAPQKILPKPMANMGISPIPTANLLKKPATIIGTLTRGTRDHRIIRGVGGTPLLVRKITQVPSSVKQGVGNANKTSVAGQSVPMVSIPSRNHMQPTQSRISVIQPPLQSPPAVRSTSGTVMRPLRPRVAPSKTGNTGGTAGNRNERKLPPSVIDLDSDSDDPVVATDALRRTRPESNDRVPDLSTETFPVRPDDGYMTLLAPTPRSDNEHSEDTEEQQDRTNENTQIFEQDIRSPTKSIDAVLETLKTKLKRVLDSAMNFSPDRELLAARAKTRAANRTIKRTVAELTSLNDSLIRAYKEYKRERTKGITLHTRSVTLGKKQKSSKMTPLDMECWRDSEPEGDDYLSDDEEDRENSQNVAPARVIRPFRTRVHRACEAKPKTANKSVQADDIKKKDYEKSIGYALLLKADYDAKRERDILKPVMVPDENFGKYEEQFISYLQHIEDHGMETEETKDLEAPTSISVNDLVEADITFAPVNETSERADPVPSTDKSINEGDDVEPMETNIDENMEILEEEHLEIVTTKSSSSDDSNSSSSSDESETETSEAATPDKKKHDKATTETQTSREDRPGEESIEKETAVVGTRAAETPVTETSSTTGECPAGNRKAKIDDRPSKNNEPKNSSRAVEEETVLAVRALIEEDSSSNSNSNTDVLNSWKPREDDDECTILD